MHSILHQGICRLSLDDNPKNEFDIKKYVENRKKKRINNLKNSEFTQYECKTNKSTDTVVDEESEKQK